MVLHDDFPLLLQLAPDFVSSRLFNREEHRAHLLQPIRVHSRHALHVLLGRHQQFVVDHVIWSVAQTKERTAGVELTGDPGPEVHIVSYSFNLSGVGEVAGANRY